MLKKVSDETEVDTFVVGQLCIEYAQPPSIPVPTPPSTPRPPTTGAPPPTPPSSATLSERFYTDAFGQCWRELSRAVGLGPPEVIGRELVRC